MEGLQIVPVALEDAPWVLCLAGELDIATSDALEQALAGAVRHQSQHQLLDHRARIFEIAVCLAAGAVDHHAASGAAQSTTRCHAAGIVALQ